MTLLINMKNINNEAGVQTLSMEATKEKWVHLYIASQKWDAIRIRLADEFDETDLMYLHTKAPIKTICNLDNYTPKLIMQLSYLYPDKSAQIRYAATLPLDERRTMLREFGIIHQG